MLCFRSEAHVHAWRDLWNLRSGEIFEPQQCWQLARAWYRDDRRAAQWRRKTADEGEAIFAAIGLTAPFWSLR